MLEIIFEDEFIIVCKKMSGIPTQTPKSGVTDMVSLLKNYRVSKGEPPYIGLVHRLDQPVEGVMVFAKDKKSAAALSAQMQAHTFGKYYYAMVVGTFSPACGTLENYLLRDGKSNVSSVVPKDTTGAKRAELSYKTVKTMEDRSLVRIQLKTGRHHQIRVQMAHAGMPLAGDRKYGAGTNVTIGAGSLALCAASLTFFHPVTGKVMKFVTKPEGAEFKGISIPQM
mgnify:CR=1 FL=1